VLASSAYGRTITKKDKGPRSAGKVGVLACLAPGTLVITSNGVKPLISINPDDKVWDGEEWVQQSGVVDRGVREVMQWHGLTLTPDHLVWAGDEWREVGKLSEKEESNALEFAAARALVADHRMDEAFWDAPDERARVYDLAHCGPRSRFTVLTLNGPVIVHNCGFGGGENAVNRMAASYGINLAALGINAKFIVDGYRNKYPKVVKLWQDYEYAFRRVLTSTRGDSYQVGRCEFVKRDDCVQIILPSGRPITYTNARIMDDPYGKRDREGRERARGLLGTLGPGGNFLDEMHTAEHFRDELLLSPLFPAQAWDRAHAEPAQFDTAARAAEMARELWKEPDAPVLSDDQLRAVDAIVRRATGM